MEMEGLAAYALIVVGLLLALLLRSVGNKISLRLRKRRARLTQARRHFVKSAMLLNKSRAEKVSASEARSLAGTAVNEADLALELNPTDAAILVVKGLALKQLRKPEAALKVLDTALSKEFAKSLSKEERADTLAQRAELMLEQIKGNRNERLQDVLKDLQESISLQLASSPSNSRVHFLLGTCCERLGDNELARVAYEQALLVNSSSPGAQAALDRVKSSSQDPSLAVSV